MKKLLLTSVLATSFAFGSATIANGSSQSISFNSSPEGASVLVDGQTKCKTPCTVSLKKNKYSSITFKKDGYTTKTVSLEKSFDGVALLNIFWDFSTTDLITGAIYEYSPNNYFVEMKKENWSYNNKLLDKRTEQELRAFIFTNYRNLKYDKEIKKVFISLLKEKNKDFLEKEILKIIEESTSPIDILKGIK